MLITVGKVLKRAIQAKAEIYHFHDPELLPGALFLKLLGKRVIYDVHEDYRSIIMESRYLPHFARPLFAWSVVFFEYLAVLFFDGIIAATPKIHSLFKTPQAILVQNYPIINEMDGYSLKPFAERTNIAAFVGGISEVRCIREMISSISLLPPGLNGKLFLVGSFRPPELEIALKTSLNSATVNFKGQLNRTEVAKILAEARCGLVLFYPNKNHIESQPNKLFEYMAAGLPVIASNFPYWKEIIDKIGCGITVDPLNPSEIANALRWVFEHPSEAEEMGKRGRKAIITKFNWNTEKKALLELYSKILHK
ncbi:MAG: glycosyltransferase [Candidatus Riflebacteria bacterium]|nr:glycosyltransferase [Candidatus Riflebacteria bacterium]